MFQFQPLKKWNCSSVLHSSTFWASDVWRETMMSCKTRSSQARLCSRCCICGKQDYALTFTQTGFTKGTHPKQGQCNWMSPVWNRRILCVIASHPVAMSDFIRPGEFSCEDVWSWTAVRQWSSNILGDPGDSPYLRSNESTMASAVWMIPFFQSFHHFTIHHFRKAENESAGFMKDRLAGTNPPKIWSTTVDILHHGRQSPDWFLLEVIPIECSFWEG